MICVLLKTRNTSSDETADLALTRGNCIMPVLISSFIW